MEEQTTDAVDVNEVPEGPSLEYADIINAARILELAVQRNAFTVKELIEFAPIISRVQDFSDIIIAEYNKGEQNNG